MRHLLIGYCIRCSTLAQRLQKREKQVAQGQYVVNNTRCAALSDCELEGGEAGQPPQRGRSPVEHRGTFVHPA